MTETCDGCGADLVYITDILGMTWCEDCFHRVPDDWPNTRSTTHGPSGCPSGCLEGPFFVSKTFAIVTLGWRGYLSSWRMHRPPSALRLRPTLEAPGTPGLPRLPPGARRPA